MTACARCGDEIRLIPRCGFLHCREPGCLALAQWHHWTEPWIRDHGAAPA